MVCIARIINPKRLRGAHTAVVHSTQRVVLRGCAFQARHEAQRTWYQPARRRWNRLSPVLITGVLRRLGGRVNLGMRSGILNPRWFVVANALPSVAGPSPKLQIKIAVSSVRSFSEPQ